MKKSIGKTLARHSINQNSQTGYCWLNFKTSIQTIILNWVNRECFMHHQFYIRAIISCLVILWVFYGFKGSIYSCFPGLLHWHQRKHTLQNVTPYLWNDAMGILNINYIPCCIATQEINVCTHYSRIVVLFLAIVRLFQHQGSNPE